MVFAYPQIEISNQLRVRCCGRVVQHGPHIACEKNTVDHKQIWQRNGFLNYNFFGFFGEKDFEILLHGKTNLEWKPEPFSLIDSWCVRDTPSPLGFAPNAMTWRICSFGSLGS
jgi:hypothetical protein